MRLRVDVSSLVFLLVSEPVAVRDFDSGRAKVEDGLPVFACRLVAMGDGEAEIVVVKTRGEPVGLVPGAAVAVEELTAQPWSMGDKSGVAFRAASLRPASSSARNGAGS